MRVSMFRRITKPVALVALVVLLAGCDLSITKSAAPDPATVGELLTYTLEVKNNRSRNFA